MITLIPKKGRDPLEVKNWRPICLLNSDYKMLSKALAARLKVVLPDIISKDQTGFVRGRDISHNIRKTIDLINYAEIRKLETMILAIDFEKAFDRVEYGSMMEILKLINIGPHYIDMIKLLFTDFYIATINAGHISETFSPTRGLFQGNPISSFLFVSIIELLAVSLRANPNIDAIEINGIKYLLSQFADDMDLFMKCNTHSFRNAIETINSFCNITGMKINLDKTTIYRIGSIRKAKAKFYSQYQVQWSDKPLNVLGMEVSRNMQELTKLNYESIIQSAKRNAISVAE